VILAPDTHCSKHSSNQWTFSYTLALLIVPKLMVKLRELINAWRIIYIACVFVTP
jgi:hypothetical protein